MSGHILPSASESDHSAPDWRISSYSGNTGGQCVEVALPRVGSARLCLVRDSKDRNGPELAFTLDEWRAFAAGVKTGACGLGDVPAGRS